MEKIINLFKREHGVYSKQLQFKLIVLCVIIVIALNYYFKDSTTNFIILAVFVIYVMSTYLTITNNESDDFNKMLMYKLNEIKRVNRDNIKIQVNRIKDTFKNSKDMKLVIDKIYRDNNLDYLYVDATLITFIYSILPLSKWNSQEFFAFLKGVNNILRLKYEIDTYYNANGQYPINTSEMLETAIELKGKTLNNLHNFIYTIPKIKIMTKYIDDILNRYHILIYRNIDSIYNSYKNNIKLKGIDNSTKFIKLNIPTPLPNNNNMVYI